MKFVYLLVFNKLDKQYECISISLDPWGKEAFPQVMKLFVFENEFVKEFKDSELH